MTQTQAIRRGAVALLALFLMIILIAMAAFAIDIAYIMTARTELQNAADSAALAGAGDLPNGQSVALATAKAFAAQNRAGNRTVQLADTDVVFGKWDPVARVFTANGLPTNAVQATASRNAGNANGALNLFFAPALGTKTVDAQGVAIAAQTDVTQIQGIPLALRNNQSFGPVNPQIAAQDPGKDGPSYPTHPTPSDPNASFAIGDVVTLASFGKGSQSAVDIVLDVPGFTRAADLLAGKPGVAPVTVRLGDQDTVLSQGSFGAAGNLGDRIKNFPDADPMRTVFMPVVNILPNSRDSSGKLTGQVQVVDFVAVHLNTDMPFVTIPDPNSTNGGTITIQLVKGTVVQKQVPSLGASRTSPSVSNHSVFALRLVQ